MKTETRDRNAQGSGNEVEFELPLVKLTKEDILGALFVNTDNVRESYKDAVLKLQTWIMNFAEEQVAPLRESGCFTDEEIETIKKKSCVISPMTLTLYVYWLQWESFAKLPDSRKEKYLLEKIPDRFKARYRGNAACRNAREMTAEEDAERTEKAEVGSNMEMPQRVSYAEFLRIFGEEVKRELENSKKEK